MSECESCCYSVLYVADVRYATEVDVDFVRKSVRAIGRCAIKVEQAAERCVSTLLDLIQTKVNYVVQEAVIVIKVCLFSRFFSMFNYLAKLLYCQFWFNCPGCLQLFQISLNVPSTNR